MLRIQVNFYFPGLMSNLRLCLYKKNGIVNSVGDKIQSQLKGYALLIYSYFRLKP